MKFKENYFHLKRKLQLNFKNCFLIKYIHFKLSQLLVFHMISINIEITKFRTSNFAI